ncbi:hypothetical protein SAG0376_03570 [Streptococcus agalactiae GB00986]|nr:hypothetical protein SAG0376_03570 [Streptococcus agalactiae GB00986]
MLTNEEILHILIKLKRLRMGKKPMKYLMVQNINLMQKNFLKVLVVVQKRPRLVRAI